jgi:hypothetical protein
MHLAELLAIGNGKDIDEALVAAGLVPEGASYDYVELHFAEGSLEIESVTLVHDPIVASAALTLEQASQEMKDFRKREAALAESHLSPGAVMPDGPLPAVPDVTYELELEGVGRDE